MKYLWMGILLLCNGTGRAQGYKVYPVNFASNYSDFSPAYCQGKMVFTSTRSIDKKKSGYSNIFMVNGDKVELFSEKIQSNYHDGPASFSADGRLMCFSSNLLTENQSKRLSIGLFFSEYDDSTGWSHPVAFEFNDPSFSNAHPSLSEDGNTLYFSSTRPGGEGGTDLYVSRKINNEWSTPENLGNQVNSSLDESFPYIHRSGRLFFSSYAGSLHGGMDIMYSDWVNDEWSFPEVLPSPINSSADDFGFYLNATQNKGMISSTRKKGKDQIYHFELSPPGEHYAYNPIKYTYEEQCLNFREIGFGHRDFTPYMVYHWLVDGKEYIGDNAKHCFKSPGRYTICLSVEDQLLAETRVVAQTKQLVQTPEMPIIEAIKTDSSKNPYGFLLNDVNLSKFRKVNVLWKVNNVWMTGRSFLLDEPLIEPVLLLILSEDDKTSYRCFEVDPNLWVH